jgi:type IX secretion system PorP/SprF family membrane protein
MMKKGLLNIFVFLSPFVALAQNEITYSQYMFNNLLVNPAYAGYKEQTNVSLLSRNQWVGIKGAPTTQSLIADGTVTSNKNVALGLTVFNDKVGIQSQTAFMANYAYRLPIGDDSRLSFGIGVGAIQFSLNGDKAIISNPTDQTFAGTENYLSPDARIGVYYNNERFYVGLSANNLLSKAINKNKSNYIIFPPIHLFLTAGTIIPLNDDVKIKPSLMLRDNPSGMGNFDINSVFMFRDMFSVGGSYRMGVDMWKKGVGTTQTFQQNSLIGLVEFNVAKQFRIGYAYDYSLSSLNSYSSGSHEISLGYTFGDRYFRNNGLTSPRYF